MNIFQELFLVIISPYLNVSRLAIEFGKNKKIHFFDPLIYELIEEWALLEIKDKENKKAEDLIASHLLRFGRKSKLIFPEVYYWRNGIEIDAVIKTRDKAIGFESKFGNKVEEIKLIHGKMKEIYLISKNSFNAGRKIIPLAVFLVLFEV